MPLFLHRLLRGTVLGVMLLLAATANLVSFSYDADDDDDTPPVTVELSIGAPVKKATHLVKQQSASHIASVGGQIAPADLLASAEFFPALQDNSSPQLVIPLRR